MNFIFTSALALQERAFQHLKLSDKLLFHWKRFGTHALAAFGTGALDETQNWIEFNDLVTTCASSPFRESSQEALYALTNFAGNESSPTVDDFPFIHTFPCLAFQEGSGYLWISSDRIGSIPIWYAFENGQLMVSSDLLVAYWAGFTEPSALGPGQVMLVDTKTNEIISITTNTREPILEEQSVNISTYTSQKSDTYTADRIPLARPPHAQAQTSILEVYARRVAMIGMNSIKKALLSYNMSGLSRLSDDSLTHSGSNEDPPPSVLTLEVDRIDDSSVYLECLFSALQLDYNIRFTRPKVTESLSFKSSGEDEYFHKTLADIHSEFMQSPSAAAREESFRSLAVERWRVCQAAAAPTNEGDGNDTMATSTRRVLVSFDSGLNPRPVEVYLQNLFCRKLNVTVVYPFLDISFQQVLQDSQHPKSYFHEALGVLRSPSTGLGTSSSPVAPFCPSLPLKATSSVYKSEQIKQVGEVGTGYEQVNVRIWSSERDLSSCHRSSCVDLNIQYRRSSQQHQPQHREDFESMENQSYTSSHPVTPNQLIRIHQVAQNHASADGVVVLLLATNGYADMLSNFLCAAHKINVSNFLILTHDEEIKHLASVFNVGFYSPPLELNTTYRPTDASFGTVPYQELVLSRTGLALELLLFGFQPVIADVDTVWLSNPLAYLPWSSSFKDAQIVHNDRDVAITDDSGEVCGCFIALRNTDQAVRFWSEVFIAHRKLVSDAVRVGGFVVFDESEQKILTELIYNRKYSNALAVLQLPGEMFPSGYSYFTLQTHRVQPVPPAVVHNNYIVGLELKRARFQRYGLWHNLNPEFRFELRPNTSAHKYRDSYHSNGAFFNQYHNHYERGDVNLCSNAEGDLAPWRKVFPDGAHRNITIPSLNIYLPEHGSVVNNTNSVMVHTSSEGPLRIRLNGGKADFSFTQAYVYVDNNPPSHLEASPAVFAVLNVTPGWNHSVLAFTATTKRDDVSIGVDVGFYRENFAIDRAGMFSRLATETVLYNIRQRTADAMIAADGSGAHDGWNAARSEEERKYGNGYWYGYLHLPEQSGTKSGKADKEYSPPRSSLISQQGVEEIKAKEEDDCVCVGYNIRVIAYNQSAALLRLLTSLSQADYMGFQNISLHISVDNSPTIVGERSVLHTLEVAEKFEWHHGPKSVQLHKKNIGLTQQWLQIWTPAEVVKEVAFVFEDDEEVSPLFFRWALRAVEKYYVTDHQQRLLHHKLLQAVRNHVQSNGSVLDNALTPLESFAQLHAGIPLVYGVCLQRQYLDPNHHPRQLNIQNGHRPYLYSLIGSWGPLLFPNTWRAFLEWQEWRRTQPLETTSPETEHLVTNFFLRENPRIWTPWHIRFAYETGGKCLYPNFPEKYALVVSHRERGENYMKTAGPDSSLIKTDPYVIFTHNTQQELEQRDTVVDQTKGELGVSSVRSLHGSFWYLPSMATLATMQYDFNLRRLGSLGVEAAHIYQQIEGEDNNGELARVHQAISTAISWHNHYVIDLGTELSAVAAVSATTPTTAPAPVTDSTPRSASAHFLLSHWIHTIDMLERVLPVGARILHLSHTPLLPLLPSVDNLFEQIFFEPRQRRSHNNSHTPSEAWNTSLLTYNKFSTNSSFLSSSSSSSSYSSSSYSSSYWYHRTTALQSVSAVVHERFNLLVIDIDAMDSLQENTLRTITSQLAPVEYVLTIGSCSAAPTDLTLSWRKGSLTSPASATASSLPTEQEEYVIVEDVCRLGEVDVGAMLYRRQVNSRVERDMRFLLSRRIRGGFQTRQLVSAAGLL